MEYLRISATILFGLVCVIQIGWGWFSCRRCCIIYIIVWCTIRNSYDSDDCENPQLPKILECHRLACASRQIIIMRNIDKKNILTICLAISIRLIWCSIDHFVQRFTVICSDQLNFAEWTNRIYFCVQFAAREPVSLYILFGSPIKYLIQYHRKRCIITCYRPFLHTHTHSL